MFETTGRYARIASLRTVREFRTYVREVLQTDLPCDDEIIAGDRSPLAEPYDLPGLRIGNRWAAQPMEGWDGTSSGLPTEHTLRRWRRFGMSGAKLIWGGEAAAVVHEGRANPNQLLVSQKTERELARLLEMLMDGHREVFSPRATDDLLVGLQLTHSGRFSRPNRKETPEPKILYHHPILDRKVGIGADYPLMSDGEIEALVQKFIEGARIAWRVGFHFVDIKHCHGYLGHEALSAFTRPGRYGGDFENRTRFLREIIQGIRVEVPHLRIGVRISAFDMVPFQPDPAMREGPRPGRGIPEDFRGLLPYRYGFGIDPTNPVCYDLTETFQLLDLLRSLNITLVNISGGSPYYTPHLQRPAYFPPSDGYLPPEDPLVGVARQIQVAAEIKQRFPDLAIVGSGYSYLQEYLPQVGQYTVREGMVDFVGLGRMMLAYPEMPRDVYREGRLDRRRLCRTFSDCTTAPRHGLISGCFPLDEYYKRLPEAETLKRIKRGR